MKFEATFQFVGTYEEFQHTIAHRLQPADVINVRLDVLGGTAPHVVPAGQAERSALAEKVLRNLGHGFSMETVHVLEREIPNLLTLIAAQRKIEAIKHLRALTNCGLKEAKDAVEGVLVTDPVAARMTFALLGRESTDPFQVPR